MRTDPFFDTFEFLISGGWPIYLFWLLLLVSAAVVIYNFINDSRQHSARDIWMCMARIIVGGMWYQQTLWKLPPYYTDLPGVPDSGLKHWMIEMVNNASFSIQSRFVKEIVLAHFSVFAPLVYALELFIAISLILGVFTRLGAALGALMAVNLWLGLYRAPYEWPWTYFFLIVLQVTFAVLQAGRSLGIDAIIVRRLNGQSGPKGMIARIIT
ncbi:MAG: DoxX family membrane protein [Syntrophobacteraceae bacterium]